MIPVSGVSTLATFDNFFINWSSISWPYPYLLYGYLDHSLLNLG